MSESGSRNTWYRLDHAGKLFPAVSGIQNSSTFRVSMMLDEKINPEILQSATDAVISRFSSFDVKINSGLFWRFLSRNENRLLVEPERLYPCAPINAKDSNGFLLRVLYHDYKISVEFFHSLTDGVGAIEFLKSLTFQYLKLSDKEIVDDMGLIIHPDSLPSNLERQDSFSTYYTKGENISDAISEQSIDAFHITGTLFEPYGNNIIQGFISSSALNKVAKSYNSTITAFLIAIMIESVNNCTTPLNPARLPIMVSVPVNLRPFFASKTLRNFFVVANIGFSVDENMTFEDILAKSLEQLQNKTQKEPLMRALFNNMKYEKHIASRFTPVKIKEFAIKLGFDRFGESSKTITLTNLGIVKLPPSMSQHVTASDSIIYPTAKSPINCAISSVNDVLTITFSRQIVENDIIVEFFRNLKNRTQLEIDLVSNDWGMKNE